MTGKSVSSRWVPALRNIEEDMVARPGAEPTGFYDCGSGGVYFRVRPARNLCCRAWDDDGVFIDQGWRLTTKSILFTHQSQQALTVF